jgi:lipopolysaccharide transport system permease protein
VPGTDQPSLLGDLWRYRRHVWWFTQQDLRSRYAGSMIGVVWALVYPLVTLAIYAIVFSQLMNPQIPQVASAGRLSFTLYLCAGLFPWVALQEAIQRGSMTFVENAPLMKKLHFPEAVFVGKAVGSATVGLLITLALFLLLLMATGMRPALPWLALPFILALQQLLAFALALCGATIHVFFRDVTHLVSLGLHAWFWLTPIVYSASVLPRPLQLALWGNPAYHLIESYHQVLLTARWPDAGHVVGMVVSAGLLFLLARFCFYRLRDDLRDEI